MQWHIRSELSHICGRLEVMEGSRIFNGHSVTVLVIEALVVEINSQKLIY